jgi:hypothetical protein
MELFNIQPGGPGQAWICGDCKLASTQTDEASFMRHLQNLHGLQDKEKEMDAETFRQWCNDAVRRAFERDGYVVLWLRFI